MAALGELALGCLSAVLLANAVLGAPKVWLLFVVAACVAAVGDITGRALEAALPRVVARESLPTAEPVTPAGRYRAARQHRRPPAR